MRRFVTPNNSYETSKILKEGMESAVGEDLKKIFDIGSLVAGGKIVVLPERITNPKPSLIDRANLVAGFMLTNGVREWLSSRKSLPQNEGRLLHQHDDILGLDTPFGAPPNQT